MIQSLRIFLSITQELPRASHYAFMVLSLAFAALSIANYTNRDRVPPVDFFSETPQRSKQQTAALPKPLEPRGIQVVRVKSTQELQKLFEVHKYNLSHSADEAQLVPGVYLHALPLDFGQSKALPITKRKELFLQSLLPFILEANTEILAERQKLERLKAALDNGQYLTLGEYQWLDDLAEKYRFKGFNYSKLDALLERVDVIPVAMALGQAAEETGWGTSYAARVKKSVFGITLSSGVKPYNSLRDSVRGYMRNLNANPAYAKMRTIRARLRKRGQGLCALKMMEGLYHYSELRNRYIKKVKSHITHNNLARFDGAMLACAQAESEHAHL